MLACESQGVLSHTLSIWYFFSKWDCNWDKNLLTKTWNQGMRPSSHVTTWCTLAVKDSFCRVGWLWMDQKTQHHSKHTQSGFSCLNWVLLFCLCPADGGSEHFQAKRFVSGSGETALLCAQSAPRRKHYLYPLSRSSLHRNSQYQPCPREWVRRTHAHKHTLTLTRIHAHAHADTFSLTHTVTPCCTARGLQYFDSSLWLCPLRLASCSSVCNVSSFFWSSSLNSTQAWLAVYVRSDLVRTKASPGPSPESVHVVCWPVQEAARSSLSVWGVQKKTQSMNWLVIRNPNETCFFILKRHRVWQVQALSVREQTATPLAPCAICQWMRSSVVNTRTVVFSFV